MNISNRQFWTMVVALSAAVLAVQWARTSLGSALGFLVTLYVVSGGLFGVWHLLDIIGEQRRATRQQNAKLPKP